MICQCGGRIPDNVEYCPYCGKRQFIRTRLEQLTNQPVEPFQGYYEDGGKKTGCVGWFVSLTLSAIILAGLFYFLWQDGDIDYILKWFASNQGLINCPIHGVYTSQIPSILTV